MLSRRVVSATASGFENAQWYAPVALTQVEAQWYHDKVLTGLVGLGPVRVAPNIDLVGRLLAQVVPDMVPIRLEI